MSFSERLEARNLGLIGLAFLLCLCIGVAAGVAPRYGVAGALGVTFAVAVVANVTLGMFLFTMLSFLETVNAGSGALSFIKLAGLILFVSWFAAQATRSQRESRSLLASSPEVAIPVILFVSWSVISIVWAAQQREGRFFNLPLPARRPAVSDRVRRHPAARAFPVDRRPRSCSER